MRKHHLVALTLGLILPLAACTQADSGSDTPPPSTSTSPAHTPGASNMQHFESADYGLRVDYPATLKLHHGFDRSYLQNGSWKAYAGPDSSGTPLASLVLPDSNPVTAGELRIGASRNPKAIRTCKKPPETMRGQVDTRSINGITFTHFEAGDAAMSHDLNTQSYRAVHDDACIAIDLMVIGTNPKVYDPPKTPPFTHAQAFTQLQKLLRGVHLGK